MSDFNGSLPPGWVEAPLGDILEVEYGKGLSAKKRRPGPVKVYASAGIVGEHDEPLVEGPVIVIGRKGAAGHVTVAEGPLWVIDTAYYARIPADINLRFVAHQLRAANLMALDHSTAIPSLSRDDIHRIRLRVPPRPEQDRIVEALDYHLSTVEVGKRHLNSAKSQIPGLEHATLRETCIPDDVPWAPLAEIADLSSGGTPSRQRSEYYGGDIPWVKIGDLTEGPVSTTEESITRDGLRGSSAELLESGTILLAMYGASIGRIGVLTIQAATNQAICAITPRADVIDRGYLFHFLRYAKPAFVEAGYGGAQPNISQRFLRGFLIPVPDIEEQRVIVAKLEAWLEAQRRLDTELTIADERVGSLTSTLFRDALTGLLVPKDPSDEPASELLARIHAERSERDAERRAGRGGRRSGPRGLVRVEG